MAQNPMGILTQFRPAAKGTVYWLVHRSSQEIVHTCDISEILLGLQRKVCFIIQLTSVLTTTYNESFVVILHFLS